MKAGKDIAEGEHIATMYTHALWGTIARYTAPHPPPLLAAMLRIRIHLIRIRIRIKHLKFVLLFVGHFCPPGSGSGSTDPIESIRIRIRNP